MGAQAQSIPDNNNNTPLPDSRVAIVTGSARGIGLATAKVLAARGDTVVIADINRDGARQAAEAIIADGGKAAWQAVDITDAAQLAAMVDKVVEAFGRVDILVNNAGILSKTPIEELTEDEWDRVMAVNVKAAVFASKLVIPHMRRQQRGRIINLSSIAGRMGGISAGCAYAVSKAALIGLTMSTARRVAADHITVNAVAPGPTDSELFRGFTPDEIRSLEASIPVGRLGQPEDIAETIAFLASDKAGFITGAVFDVNGGIFMG